MSRKDGSQQGFTILELVIVVVLMGLLAGLALPDYSRTRDKNTEKAAFRSMMIIKQAVRMYRFREEQAAIPDLANYTEINNTLEISLYDIEDVAISCVAAGADGPNQCTAAHADGWALRFHDDADTEVYCAGGGCPTCNADGNGATAGCNHLE